MKHELSFTSFGDLLHHLRVNAKPKKISQEKLAETIGISRQYLNAIEKSRKSASLNLMQCILISEILDLDGDLKQNFFLLAFKERIQQDWDFFEFLNNRFFHTMKPLSEHMIISNQSVKNEDDKTYKCLYLLSFYTLEKREIFSPEIAKTLKGVILKVLDAATIGLTGLHVGSNIISLVIDTNPSFQAETFIKGLKESLSKTIQNQIPGFQSPKSQLWDKHYSLFTLGELDDNNAALFSNIKSESD